MKRQVEYSGMEAEAKWAARWSVVEEVPGLTSSRVRKYHSPMGIGGQPAFLLLRQSKFESCRRLLWIFCCTNCSLWAIKKKQRSKDDDTEVQYHKHKSCHKTMLGSKLKTNKTFLGLCLRRVHTERITRCNTPSTWPFEKLKIFFSVKKRPFYAA